MKKKKRKEKREKGKEKREKKKSLLHPQTQLPARRAGRDPVDARMEPGHRRHGRDPAGVGLVAELGDLVPVGGVDVDEAVHVADAEALDGGGGPRRGGGGGRLFVAVGDGAGCGRG